MINPAKSALLNQAQQGEIDLTKVDMRALNMLNTKYIKIGDEFVMENPDALGNAWLVSEVEYADGADAEMAALKKADPAVKAVADSKYKATLGASVAKQPGDTISLSAPYKPNELRYRATTKNGGIAVFSEVFFPWGWTATVDGKDTPIACVDYTLRGIRVPAGSHEIVMRFDPQSIHATEKVAYTSITIVYIALIIALLAAIAACGRRKE